MSNRTFGLRAEEWVIHLLRSGGYRVKRGSRFEDKGLKIDFWVWYPKGRKWLPIQFTVNLAEARGSKGMDVLSRGVIISWLPGIELEMWANSGDHLPVLKKSLIAQFWEQTEGVLREFGPRLQIVWNQPWWQTLLPE